MIGAEAEPVFEAAAGAERRTNGERLDAALRVSAFTYRTARSGSLVVGLAIMTGVEVALADLLLRSVNPVLAAVITAISVAVVVWFAADYRAFGHGVVRIEDQTLDLRVGRRVTGRVPLSAVLTAVHATWRDLPVGGSRDGGDYRNLMKPAPPNVLLTLIAPSPVRWWGVTMRPRRVGLKLDDPDGFVSALHAAQAESSAAAIFAGSDK